MPEWIGQTVGKVRIEKYLASGGMAEVYLGTHLTLDRPVAVKVLHSHVESNPDLQARFQREAKAVAALRHPNIVQILDYDTYNGHPYIVMEYLKGPSLSTYLRTLHENKIKLPLHQIGHLLGALATSLDYAHSQGVIHRDIKPANILLHSKHGEVNIYTPLTNDVEPIITDFGLARLAHSVTQTESGLISGTPAYMSPEQARGTKVDHRSDIYSLGVILYELLAGRVPFEGESTITVILKHINEPPPSVEDLAPELQSIIDKVLAKEPEHRYQSGRDLAVDFYEAVGMHTEATTIHALQFSKPKTVSVTKKKSSRSPLWIGAGIFVCICISIFLVSSLGLSAWLLSPNRNAVTDSPTEVIPVTIPTQNLQIAAETPGGVLRFQNGSAILDKITISAVLDPHPPNTQYEAWLISDDGEARRSLGVLIQNSAHKYVLTYVDPQSRNMLDGFNRFELTIETDPDDSPNPSRDVAYSSALPDGSLMHIRHLMVAYDGAPNKTALAVGLYNTAQLVKESADEMLKAYDAGDVAKSRANAEAILNLINGNQSPDFHKDWDGNGKVIDPGDGFGLLLNGDNAGYIDGTIKHAELAAAASDSTEEIRMHAEHVTISAGNVEDWIVQLRDIVIRITQSKSLSPEMQADVRTASALANQLFEGVDINGNESIDPITGEGGVVTAYEHAEYMADMSILRGESQDP